MVVLGIDDAGRGPVIGPMVIAGVILSDKQESKLMKAGVTDSKLLFHTQRLRIAQLIKANSNAHKILKIYPEDIDSSLRSGTNLNTLEAKYMAKIINTLASKQKGFDIVVDCPSNNITTWSKVLKKFITQSGLDIKCEHKADLNHTPVAAASILAKVVREEEMDKLRKKFIENGNVGSGYPSDPVTKMFIREHGNELKDSGIFRKTWSTWRALYPDKQQKKLGDF